MTHTLTRMALVLIGCLVAGCVGASPQNHAWPWNSKNGYDMKQTGNFIGVTGGVAQFGDAPEAVKPISLETTQVPRAQNAAPESPPLSAKPDAKTDTLSLSSATTPGLNKKMTSGAEYDFSLRVITVAPPSYLPVDAVTPEYPVIAYSRGMAPVSLVFDIDSLSHQTWSSDKPLPLYAVVPPNSELIVARLSAKTKHNPGSIRSSYSWALGDYNASQSSPEHYQFPFPMKVTASATIATRGRPSPADGFSVIFVMPVGTPILAARKGTVMRITGSSKVDVLHDDFTIATYEHLGGIAAGMAVGSVVATEDGIGIVGALGKEKEGYLRLTVWRPEPHPSASPKAGSVGGFDFVSLPLEFCSPNFKTCRALTSDQTVSRSPLGKKKTTRGRVAGR